MSDHTLGNDNKALLSGGPENNNLLFSAGKNFEPKAGSPEVDNPTLRDVTDGAEIKRRSEQPAVQRAGPVKPPETTDDGADAQDPNSTVGHRGGSRLPAVRQEYYHGFEPLPQRETKPAVPDLSSAAGEGQSRMLKGHFDGF